ncbi:Glyoxalase/Bleomycin resistance protein/Dihydroxybiphenyl dioxygenase [Biscogniauxia marginata]|nr:Glyoxalase/Bleomycin resistance protein/Dihydroxybiphenyl dioxygenase [Biscogniauxia marginata]
MSTDGQNTVSGKVIAPAKLAHVVLRTLNLEPMVAFYEEFLGARKSFENKRAAFLSYDEEHHRLAIIKFPGLKEREKGDVTVGMDHIAFAFNSLDDLVQAYQQRKMRGIIPFWCVNHGPTTSMYYQDPDGNKIEMQVDNFDTAEEGNAYMAGPEFAENPIGVDFDPEILAKRLKSEESREIKKRPNIGRRGGESVPRPMKPVIAGI